MPSISLLHDHIPGDRIYLEYLNGNFTRINRENIYDRSRTFSEGGSAKVFTAKLKVEAGADETVALKVFKRSDLKTLAKEMYIASKLNHANIVKIKGFYIEEEEGNTAIVAAWANGGTLVEYVRGNPGCDLIMIASGIAAGLEYMHNRGIMHCDLKGDNILMTKEGVPMISDFGQARARQYSMRRLKSDSYRFPKGTANWTAPELASYVDDNGVGRDIICTEKSDMWAYGMIIYELITGKIPFAETLGININRHLRTAKILAKIRSGMLPRKKDMFTLKPVGLKRLWLWYRICIPCWESTPEKRLTARQALRRLAVGPSYRYRDIREQ